MQNNTSKQAELENVCKMAMKAIKECITNRDFQNAEKLINQYLLVKNDSESRQYAAMIKMNLGKYQEAKELCIENIKTNKSAEDYTNIALIEKALNNFESAYGYAKYAYELKPTSAAIIANFAIVSKILGKNRQAKNLIDRAVELDPKNWMYIFNKASLFSDEGNLVKAKEFYDIALQLNPLEINVNIDYFYCLAKMKFYKKAWPFYEYRYFKIKSLQKLIKELNRPVLQTKQETYSQNICVIPEQGMGDNLMFLRFIKEFQRIAPYSYYLCPPSLTKIVAQMNINSKNDFDESSTHVVGIMSLPYHLNIEKIPNQEVLINNKSKLNNKIKIGICWAGSPNHPMDKDRSTYLSCFEPFLKDESFEIYSFQKETRPRKYTASKKIYDYAKGMENYKIINLSDQLIDGYETANLISNMDLFISVDSYPIHLAGLVNVPAYVLVGNQPDWRWGLQGDKSDWYNNVTIVRKKKRESYKKTIISYIKRLRTRFLLVLNLGLLKLTSYGKTQP